MDDKALKRSMTFYERYIKRMLDFICALLAIIVFGWLYIIVAILVKIKLGSPVIFRQPRPGMVDPKTGKERIFWMYKFRTMSNEKDKDGKLLPDEERMGSFGKRLRSTSLDELPEAINILKGDMSIIGPRPQLVRDMVFMTHEQRIRHTARPGLSGLAQTKGRNALNWEEKLKWDLEYIQKVSFLRDVKIIIQTVLQVFIKPKITDMSDETDLAKDYGDVLLESGKVTKEQYDLLQEDAKRILAEVGIHAAI